MQADELRNRGPLPEGFVNGEPRGEAGLGDDLGIGIGQIIREPPPLRPCSLVWLSSPVIEPRLADEAT